MSGFWMPVLWLTVLSGGAVAAVRGRRAEWALGPTMMGTALLLYGFAAAGRSPAAGAWTATALAAVGWGAALIGARRNWRRFRRRLMTPAVAVFGGWSMILALLHLGRRFREWDEFSHWGLAARTVWESGRLPCELGGVLALPAYPPGMALWQYFVLWVRGAFAESAVQYATAVLAAGLLAPALRRVRWRDWGVWVPWALAGWLVPLVGFEFFYSSYVDGIVGAVFAYGLLLIASLRRPAWPEAAALAVAAGFLVLVKQSGIGFVAVLAAVLAARWWCRRRAGFRSLPAAGMLLAAAVVPPALLGSWNALVARSCCRVNFSHSAGMTPSGVWRAVTENVPEHAHVVIGRWLETFWGSWGMGSFWLLLAAAVGIVLETRRRGGASERNFGRLLAGLLLAGGCGYATVLLGHYLFTFPRIDALRLSSFERYFGSFSGAAVWLALVLPLGGGTASGRRRRHRIGVGLLALVLLVSALPLGRRAALMAGRNYWMRRPFDEVAGAVRAALGADGRLWLCAPGRPGMEYYLARYYFPGRVRALPWSVARPGRAEDPWMAERTPEELDRMLAGTGYVLLMTLTDGFRRDFGDRFAAGETPEAGRLYRIGPDGKWRKIR